MFVLQSDQSPEASWAHAAGVGAPRDHASGRSRFFTLDAFEIAAAEASDVELRYRMQGAAFMGAFFATSPLLAREGNDESALFDGIRHQLEKKFGDRGGRVVEDNLRVIRRGFDEVRAGRCRSLSATATARRRSMPEIPALLDEPDAAPGHRQSGPVLGAGLRTLRGVGRTALADPFAAISAIPAATGAMRDMSGVRLEVPEFIAEQVHRVRAVLDAVSRRGDSRRW